MFNNNFFFVRECLKLLEIEKNRIVCSTEFVGNRQIVRTSTYNPKVSIIKTLI